MHYPCLYVGFLIFSCIGKTGTSVFKLRLSKKPTGTRIM